VSYVFGRPLGGHRLERHGVTTSAGPPSVRMATGSPGHDVRWWL